MHILDIVLRGELVLLLDLILKIALEKNHARKKPENANSLAAHGAAGCVGGLPAWGRTAGEVL